MDRRQDMAVALIFLMIGAGYFWLAGDVVGPASPTEPLGEAFFPRVLAVMMMVVGLFVFADHLHMGRRKKKNILKSLAEADEPGYPVFPMRPLVLAGLMFLYASTWTYLGYVVGTFLVSVLGLALLGRRDWKRIAVTSLGYAVFLYLVFAVVMGVRNIPLLPFWMS